MMPSDESLFLGNWPKADLETVPSCPVCQSRDRALLYDDLADRIFWVAPGKWAMWRCLECASGFLDPRPTRESIHRAYTKYYTHGPTSAQPQVGTLFGRLRRGVGNAYRNARFGTRRPAVPFASALVRFWPELRRRIDMEFRLLPYKSSGCQRLLDVGCGNGDFLLRARDAGWRVAGTEPDAVARDAALNNGLDVRPSIEDFPEEGRFDYITANHVIEHVHDPQEFLESIKRRLKSGGGLFLETPNIDAPSHARYGSDWRGLEPPRHLVMFGRKALAYLITRTGFVKPDFHQRFDVRPFLEQQSEAVISGVDPNTGQNRGIPRVRTPAKDIVPDAAGYEFLTVSARSF